MAMMLAACSSQEANERLVDQSKLSAKLEARAAEIEQRADQAAAEAERQASEELAALNAEAARAATPPESETASTDDGG